MRHLETFSQRRCNHSCERLWAARHRPVHSLPWELFWTGILVFGLATATSVRGQNSSATTAATQIPPPSCTTTEPIVGLPNLDFVKKKLIAYHDCVGGGGGHETDLEKVGGEPLNFLKQYRDAHSNDKNLAVVIDIDETALSNWDNMKKMDFAYDHDESLQWGKPRS
jgi:hypothetical protein